MERAEKQRTQFCTIGRRGAGGEVVETTVIEIPCNGDDVPNIPVNGVAAFVWGEFMRSPEYKKAIIPAGIQRREAQKKEDKRSERLERNVCDDKPA